MNCKPNDLALIVRSTSGFRCISNVIGSPVQVSELRSVDTFGYGPSWFYRGALRCPNCKRELAYLLDADLQPLRGVETPAQIIRELTA
jgi:hypothetical protein